MKKELSIIIVSFNTRELTEKCVESIVSSHPKVSYEIIVVDNGSEDGTAEALKKFDIEVIENKENLGFAKSHNQGMKIATGDYFLNLDSDIVVKPGSLEKLLAFAKSNSDGAVFGGRLINPDGSNQASVRNLPTLQGAFEEYWLNIKEAFGFYSPTGQSPKIVGVVRGACFLIPRKITEKIGFFDEKYFLYFEEIDFCRKAKKSGYKVYYVPESVFIHHVGASGKEIPQKTQKWLIESSKLYHGLIKYWILTFIIWSGQKWRKLFGQK